MGATFALLASSLNLGDVHLESGDFQACVNVRVNLRASVTALEFFPLPQGQGSLRPIRAINISLVNAPDLSAMHSLGAFRREQSGIQSVGLNESSTTEAFPAHAPAALEAPVDPTGPRRPTAFRRRPTTTWIGAP
jgi:hypothetical protein